MTNNTEMDTRIRLNILFEYCKRSFEKSDNPEMHFYVIPELRHIDNETIKTNAVRLIDTNLVRGGLDDDGSQTFPWIRRITPAGMDSIQRLVDESEPLMSELRDELKAEMESKDRILGFISFCLRTNEFPTKILQIATNIGV